MRRAFDEVTDTYADCLRSTEPELPVELALVEHFATCFPAKGMCSMPGAAPAG